MIDIGSNTGRAVVIQPRPGGHLEVIEEARLPLRLGAALDDDGRLGADAYTRLAEAIEVFLAVSNAAGAERVLAVGTSALREATNGAELIGRVRDRFGLEIRVIDGEQEGHYGFLGAVHGLPVEHGMLIDIGGGSVELARFHERRVEGLWSFRLGTLHAGARFLRDDPPSERQVTRLQAATEAALREANVPRLGRGERLVGTGGAIRNVAKIDRRRRRRTYPVPRLHGYEVRRGRIAKVANLLRSLSSSERSGIPGLNPGRVETIVAGVTVLETVMSLTDAGTLIVSGQGLREGVVRGALGEALPPADLMTTLPDPRRVRDASMRALAARFAHLDGGAAQRQTWTALELAACAGLAVGEDVEELIGYAATMVGVGAAIDFYNRERVAAGIVTTTDLSGFSHLMIAELAALLHLIDDATFDVHRFAPLVSRDERDHLDVAAAALSLSLELHRRVAPAAIEGIEITASNKAINLDMPVRVGALPAPLIERVEGVFGRRLRVRVRHEG